MSSATPRVSVVIIFLNAERFFAEALDSVLAQTYDNWELLLVDDGSTDGSTELALRYAARDPKRIRYLEHPQHANRGKSASRNRGIEAARGEYVAFLDADDQLFPVALEEQATVLDTHPEAGMAYGPLEYWYSWTGAEEDGSRDFVHDLRVLPETLFEPPTLLTLFLQNRAVTPSGVLVRRAVAEQVGGYEESFRNLYEDQVFAAKVCLAAPVYVSGSCWYRYRQHPESSCMKAKRDGTYAPSREPFLRWLLRYLEARGLHGTEVWHTARAELERARAAPPSRFARMRRILASSRRGGGR